MSSAAEYRFILLNPKKEEMVSIDTIPCVNNKTYYDNITTTTTYFFSVRKCSCCDIIMTRLLSDPYLFENEVLGLENHPDYKSDYGLYDESYFFLTAVHKVDSGGNFAKVKDSLTENEDFLRALDRLSAAYRELRQMRITFPQFVNTVTTSEHCKMGRSGSRIVNKIIEMALL